MLFELLDESTTYLKVQDHHESNSRFCAVYVRGNPKKVVVGMGHTAFGLARSDVLGVKFLFHRILFLRVIVR